MKPFSVVAALLVAFSLALSHPVSAQDFVEDYQAVIKGTPLLTPVLAADGNYLVGGSIDFFGDELSGAILKITPKGQRVTGFNRIVADGDINHILALSDGKFMASGKFTMVNGDPSGKLVRFNSDGSVDESFDTNSTDEIQFFNIQSTGKIIIAGLFVDYAAHGYANLARLNPDGSLDETFSRSSSGFPNEIVINDHDEIFLDRVYSVAKLTPDGDVDASFHVDLGSNTSISHLDLYTDSTLLVASRNYSANTNSLYRLNKDGSIDGSFNTIVTSHQVLSFAKLASGDIAMTGVFSEYNGEPANVILFHSDGTFDRILATVDVNSTHTVFEDPLGGIVLAGEFQKVNDVSNYHLARLNPDYSVDREFAPQITRSFLAPAIGIQSDGKLIVGGTADFVGAGDGHITLTRLNTDGTVDASYTPDINSLTLLASMEIQPDDRVLLSGLFFENFSGGYQFLRLLPNGQRDEAFAAAVGIGPQRDSEARRANVIRVHKNKIYIGGDFAQFNSQPYPYLVILDDDGNIIGPAEKSLPVNSVIADMEIESDGKIVLSGSFPFSADYVPRIIRLLQDGTVDPSFSGTRFSSAFISDVAVDSHDRVIVIGGFEEVNGVPVKNLVRLNNDGTVDAGFNTGASVPEDIDNTMLAATVLPTDIIAISGSFEFYNNESTPGLVLIDPTGARIPFDADINPASQISKIAFRNNILYGSGRIIFGGGENVSSAIKVLFDLPVAVEPTVSEDQGKKDFVFPNPFKDRIYVNLPSGGARVRLYSETGILLKDRESPGGGPVMLDSEGLQPGLFFVKIQSHDGIISILKIVKN